MAYILISYVYFNSKDLESTYGSRFWLPWPSTFAILSIPSSPPPPPTPPPPHLHLHHGNSEKKHLFEWNVDGILYDRFFFSLSLKLMRINREWWANIERNKVFVCTAWRIRGRNHAETSTHCYFCFLFRRVSEQ